MPLGAFKSGLMAAAGGGGAIDAWDFLAKVTVSGDTSTKAITFTSAGSANPWTDYEHLYIGGTLQVHGAGTAYDNIYTDFNQSTIHAGAETPWNFAYWRAFGTAASMSEGTGQDWTSSALDGLLLEVGGNGVDTATHWEQWIYDINKTDRWMNTSVYYGYSLPQSGSTRHFGQKYGIKDTGANGTTAVVSKVSIGMSSASGTYLADGTTFGLWGIKDTTA